MKAMVYSTYYATPHLETDLELISCLLKQRAEVYVVRCFGELETCLVNPGHEKTICDICIRKYNNGLKLSGVANNRIIRLPKCEEKMLSGIPSVFSSVEELKAFKIDNVDFGMAAIGSLISRYRKDHKFDTIEKRIDVHNELRMCVALYCSFLDILDRIRPDVVYVFNGRFSTHRPVVRACENKKITFITHERSGTNTRYALTLNALNQELEPAKREVLELWNAANSARIAIGQRFYQERRDNVEQGWISFTKYQEIGKLPVDFNKQKKNIAIFNSTIEEYESIECRKNPFYKDENDGIRRLFDSFRGNSSIHFYLRVHPHLMDLENSQIREIRDFATYSNVTIIMPGNRSHTYSLLDNCNCVITYGSTLGVEACYWGKPSILCGRAVYEDLDCCYVPKDHDDLVRLLHSDLEPKSKEGCFKYGYWEMTKGKEYEFFEPIGLFGGLFKGKRLDSENAHKGSKRISLKFVLDSTRRLGKLVLFGKNG